MPSSVKPGGVRKFLSFFELTKDSCGFSDRHSFQYAIRYFLASTHRHNWQLERTQRNASIRSQHIRQEIILNAVAAHFMAQNVQILSSRINKTPMFELPMREMASNGGDLTHLGILMDAMQIDTSAAELEEIFRDVDNIDEGL
ncbi:hypothetical protein RUND412_008624 [Rhizina undulata]